MTWKVVRTILIVLVAIVVVLGVWVYLTDSAPFDDMRQRLDAVQLPRDFVLVKEEQSGSAGGLFGSLPSIQRLYHAAWPGLCDTLRSIQERTGEAVPAFKMRPEWADRICYFPCMYRTGWKGRIRNYRRYDFRLQAWERGMLEQNRIIPPGPPLTREQLEQVYPEMAFPPGRAKVLIQIIAHKGS